MLKPGPRMKIVLARHGKPNLPIGVWIAPIEMKEWISRYNEADVVFEHVLPAVKEVAEASSVIVSSPHRRCQQSAQHLVPGRSLVIEDMFREADLPYPSWDFPRLPLAVFGIAFRLAWFKGFSANAESLAQARLRARSATERLVQLAQEKGSVFLMGHGVMSILIAEHLLALGWKGPKRPINKHWQYSVYHAVA